MRSELLQCPAVHHRGRNFMRPSRNRGSAVVLRSADKIVRICQAECSSPELQVALQACLPSSVLGCMISHMPAGKLSLPLTL